MEVNVPDGNYRKLQEIQTETGILLQIAHLYVLLHAAEGFLGGLKENPPLDRYPNQLIGIFNSIKTVSEPLAIKEIGGLAEEAETVLKRVLDVQKGLNDGEIAFFSNIVKIIKRLLDNSKMKAFSRSEADSPPYPKVCS